MEENRIMKAGLIIQSFSPLFCILLIKYFDFEAIGLIYAFAKSFVKSPFNAIKLALCHPLLCTFVLEIVCLIWVMLSVLSYVGFMKLEEINFHSSGRSLGNINDVSESSATFFMTYVAPMVMDDLNEARGLLSFTLFMLIIAILMWRSNLYYQNPILTILGYRVFSFSFESAKQNDCSEPAQYIGIARETIYEGKSIMTQKISGNVYMVRMKKRNAGKE